MGLELFESLRIRFIDGWSIDDDDEEEVDDADDADDDDEAAEEDEAANEDEFTVLLG